MPKGNRPIYLLKVVNKDNTKQRTIAGAAFASSFNQIRIVLNPGLSLSWKDELYIVLDPMDPDDPPIRFKGEEQAEDNTDTSNDRGGGKGDDGDIPF